MKAIDIEQCNAAAQQLETIKKDKERLDVVLSLQRILIRSIFRCEHRIRRLRRARMRVKRKKAGARLSREESVVAKRLVILIDERIKEVHQKIFLWRCFGDGIAYIYQSKYSLKHLFYDGEYVQKQGPGFISGKNGFRKEYKILCMAIRMNVPIVMSDLTNVIRHGDLCALAGADPLPVEIKSSSNKNARVGRQLADLNELAEFYANDGAANYRGVHNTVRVEIVYQELNYENEVNACIDNALNEGCCIVTPEEGLKYLAFTNEFADTRHEDLNEMFASAGSGNLVAHLTPDPNWLPLYPFTLSLSSKNLIPFISRRINLFVLIDMLVIKRKFSELGVFAIVIMDGSHSLQLCLDPLDLKKGVFRVSEQLFARIWCEFQSVDWFVKENASIFGKVKSVSGSLLNCNLDWPIPDDWRDATCRFGGPV